MEKLKNMKNENNEEKNKTNKSFNNAIKYFYIKKDSIIVGNFSKDDKIAILNNLNYKREVVFITEEIYKKVKNSFGYFDTICISNAEVDYYKNEKGAWIEQ
ncbi:MAG: hypothetical protein M1168_00825 [Candidatus Marsarchaeota archaeon]|nr:hypothetical protein [Candidatus Marsarchaeota archaeon]MCL5094514.1 hypothetical protein [Candidatus Marsarchaeota archaeon]